MAGVPGVAAEIRAHYESVSEDERLRREAGRLEFVRTQQIIRRYLPARTLRILDVGGATGVHTAWLADDDHQVHLVDAMPHHVAQAQRLAGPGRRITAEVGDARSLRADDDSVDAVLLLGPLYHLIERDDRLRALEESRRVLRPGGLLFVAAISRFASLIDGLSREFLFDPGFRPIVERDLVGGQHRNPDHRPHWFTTAYFHHPDDLRQEAVAAGLDVLDVLGVEGIAGWFRDLDERWDDPADREAILFAAQSTEAEPSLLGASSHLLLVAHRPST